MTAGGLNIFLAPLLVWRVSASGRSPIAFRTGDHASQGWRVSEEACDGDVQFTLFLKQQGLDKLNAAFRAVSEPDSPSYRKYLSKEEVDKMVSSSAEASADVTAWLGDHGIPKSSIDVNADSIAVKTDCTRASSLFEAPFRRYSSDTSAHSPLLLHGVATIPMHLSDHVDFVMGISELWHGRPRSFSTRRSRKYQSSDDMDLKVTPKLLQKYYGVPEDETNAAPEKNLQSVAAFDDYFSQGALEAFYANMSASAPTLQVVGIDCLKHYDKKMCDQVESDLDVQYMTAMAGMGSVQTLFHASNTSDGWVLAKSENLLKLSPVPYVFSVSYGWAELKQCDLDVMVCFKLGYQAQQYVDRTNVNFQKLAVMGTTIFVSDGDDGAQGVQPSGWDPLDLDHWCPGEYTCYPRPEKNSKCGEVLLHNVTSGKKCVWPVGHMSDSCSWLFLGDFYQDDDIEKALKSANPSCNLQFFIDSSYNTHMYSECECSKLSLTHKDVISESFADTTSKPMFFADFPTSSPYVTSVGATVFKTTDGKSISAEHAASIKDGAIITTGGGFSAMAPTPDYQKEDIKQYIAGSTPKPPAASYNSTGRGYPDITLNGHNYQVFYPAKDDTADCPCTQGGVDGTSASSPAVAGMVSLINGHLLAAGKGPVGFLNPLLYKAHAEDPSIFNDITVGDNSCTRDYCMIHGYTAGKGWDPVAGLGSINYAKLKAYVLKQPTTEEVIV
jgi:subtilase family serine protease